eukprot:TRINITY_DN15704_c1_g1_i3.p1 TRINITY_DN15704_c1_g1~~TRINITY_DN15704_c1_g1_i3.p1  ORF type:complete len:117 (-),score=13.05 TRINITY_DN15704_c1_g1_i3:75-425(-)
MLWVLFCGPLKHIRRIAADLRPLSYCGADVFLLAFFLISKASYENVARMRPSTMKIICCSKDLELLCLNHDSEVIRRIAADLRPLSYCGADVFLLAFFLISKASYENVARMYWLFW